MNIRSSKYICLQLAITAWLYPAIDPRSGFLNNATRESKYVNNLIEARKRDEDDFAYIMRIKKLYNINIWVYTPCSGGREELFKPVDDFDKDGKDVSILVWGNGLTGHCAPIKNIETLLDIIKITLTIIIVIDVHIGLIQKLNTKFTNVTTLSNSRLFVLRRRK